MYSLRQAKDYVDDAKLLVFGDKFEFQTACIYLFSTLCKLQVWIAFLLDQQYLVEWKGEDSYTVLSGKRINQSKTAKPLSDLNVRDTVVGTKDFEATVLKVGKFL